MAGLDDALRLAEALCARVCHDLSGPLGILGNMLELLQEDGADRAEAQGVAFEAAISLQRRLQFIRAAWGGSPGPLSVEETRTLAAGLPGADRIVLDLDALTPDLLFPAEAGRALLGALFMAADGLPAGGRIAVTGSPDDMIILVDGPNAAWPAGLAECLRDDGAILAAIDRPRRLSVPLAILLARGAGLEISMLLTSGQPGAGPPPVRIRAN